jgi:hypothetical protein
MTTLNFTANAEGKYEATYEGETGALQIVCEPGSEVFVMGDAGAGVYHTLEGGILRGEKFLRMLDMTGLVRVRIESSTKPIKAIVGES